MKKDEEYVLIKQTVTDIAKQASKRFNGINTPEIKMIINEVFQIIEEMLLDKNYIVIQDFGVFFTDYLEENNIKDPRNNDIYHYPKRRVPRFYFSRNLKKRLKNFDKKK